MGNVTLTSSSKLTLKDESKLSIKSIDAVKKIDPVAVHLKEVNHIDPLSIDALHVSEIKNIEPLEVSSFNVSHLPMVNMSLQKLPPAQVHVKSLPPVSIGTYQNFAVPSHYTLHARLFGIEIMRLHLNGQTNILPTGRARREQSRSDNKSFPETAAAGNPSIPTTCKQKGSSVSASTVSTGYQALTTHQQKSQTREPVQPSAGGNTHPQIKTQATAQPPAISFGRPQASFTLPSQAPTTPEAGCNISHGV